MLISIVIRYSTESGEGKTSMFFKEIDITNAAEEKKNERAVFSFYSSDIHTCFEASVEAEKIRTRLQRYYNEPTAVVETGGTC